MNFKTFVQEAIKLSNDAPNSNMEITGQFRWSNGWCLLADNENNPNLAHKNYKGYAFGNPLETLLEIK